MHNMENKTTCGAPRAIDDAKVRTEAFCIQTTVTLILGLLTELEERLRSLDEEIEFADPIKDREFEQFVLKLSRVILTHHTLNALWMSATAMQKFGLPTVANPLMAEAQVGLSELGQGIQPAVSLSNRSRQELINA